MAADEELQQRQLSGIAVMNVQEFRRANGYTLRKMAEIACCSASNIMRIESGQKPLYELAERIVRATGGVITMAEIYRNGAKQT